MKTKTRNKDDEGNVDEESIDMSIQEMQEKNRHSSKINLIWACASVLIVAMITSAIYFTIRYGKCTC